jgi:hypothetical protein
MGAHAVRPSHRNRPPWESHEGEAVWVSILKRTVVFVCGTVQQYAFAADGMR